MAADTVPSSDIGPDTRISRIGDWLSAETGDGLVMMSPSAAEYLGLSETGARVWALLEEPRTLAELCAALAGEFAVTADEVRPDVVEFVAQLAERGALALG